MTHQLLTTQPASERIKTEAEALTIAVQEQEQEDSLYTLCVNALAIYDSDERRENVATIEYLSDEIDSARHRNDIDAGLYLQLEEQQMRDRELLRTLERKVCEINAKIPSLSHEELITFFKETFASALKEEQGRKALLENLRKNALVGVSTSQAITKRVTKK